MRNIFSSINIDSPSFHLLPHHHHSHSIQPIQSIQSISNSFTRTQSSTSTPINNFIQFILIYSFNRNHVNN
ncbi:hypothetical protein EYC80_003431 [Monilinia laxa]|uniref:Uncharacterized protein n=1 Tax=Monilinia laxa TaxID=61186 RepID=A0A5N6KDP2_MONLA|nr:hypothetical protein EYC80_003431 [Monilinia laxa]